MIGKIYSTRTPYYDSKSPKKSYKSRPVLIIHAEKAGDYVVLPISRVTNSKNLDKEYDIPVTMAKYPLLGLTADSYIRTHKQTTVNKNDTAKFIADLKNTYPTLYKDVISKLAQFNIFLISNA